MFDGLLKSKFYCKCKSDIKQARTRIELIRKKRNAMQKYLRNDIADLLIRGLDINAYGRADGLLGEMNRSSCYEFVGQCYEHISNNVSAMDKQRECPEDCRETVSTLMYAAARFADMPELRELRTLFSGRYGNSLDCFINKEFAEKMKSVVPSKDLKLQLLQEISAESGLDWDSKDLENKLLYDRGTTNELKYARQFDPQMKKEPLRYEQKVATRKEYRLPKKKEVASVKDIPVVTIRKTEEPNEQASLKNVHERKYEGKPHKYCSIPPPYLKSKVNKPNYDQEAKAVPKSVRRRNLKPETEEERAQQMNKEQAAQGQRILKFFEDGGQRDDEEKTMDKLLHHYSRKNGSSSYEKGKAIKHKTTNRACSLPADLTSQPEDSKKQHTRCSSFQRELLRGNNAHVHPKLPDYDVFVARLAALRGNEAD